MFSVLSRSHNLQSFVKVSQAEARAIEVQALLASSILNRRHGILQSSLNSTTYLAQLVKPCDDIGLKIDAAASLEASNVLWDQGEMAASIRMLQDLVRGNALRSQDIPVGRPEILAKLVNSNACRIPVTLLADNSRAIEYPKLDSKSLTRSLTIISCQQWRLYVGLPKGQKLAKSSTNLHRSVINNSRIPTILRTSIESRIYENKKA